MDTVLAPVSILALGHLFLRLVGKATIPYSGKIQAYVLSLTLGFCLLSVVPFALNLAQLDARPFFWIFYTVGILYTIFFSVRVISRSKHWSPLGVSLSEERIPEITILAVAVIAAVSLIFLSALNPGNDWDAIQLYLPMGKIIFQNGILPVYSTQIGREFVNFFLIGYVYGYAMTISGNFLDPPSIIGIVSISLLGLMAATYELASLFLHALTDRLLATTYLLTLPLLAYYFAYDSRYADIPSVFLALGLVLLVFSYIRDGAVGKRIFMTRNLIVGMVTFVAIGYKLQNLLILPLLALLLFEKACTVRRRLHASGALLLTFAFVAALAWSSGTVFGGLSAGGLQSPIVIIVAETMAVLLFFCVLFVKRPNTIQPSGLWAVLPGSLAGLVLWVARPTLLGLTPFFPVTLPSRPEFLFAKQTYSSIVSALFGSPLTQYGALVPYTSPYLGLVVLPLILTGAYSFLRRGQTFILKWVLLSIAAATLVTAYVDARYAFWVAPLSGILAGESMSFMRNRGEASFRGLSLLPLFVMAVGLAMFHEIRGLYQELFPLYLASGIVAAAYTVMLVSSSLRLRTFVRRISAGRAFNHPYAIVLLACLCVSLFSFTYLSLIVEDQNTQGQQPDYGRVYAFLKQNVTRGSTVLSIGFPGIYYYTGLNSVPLDDPEGLAQLYKYANEANSSAAALQFSSDMHATSIVVPSAQYGYWYHYFTLLENRVPFVSDLASEPVSHIAFTTRLYYVYNIS